MKLRILGCGTSSGVPRIGNDWGACDPLDARNRRRRVSIIVEFGPPGAGENGEGGSRILVDTGPDLREQLLDADVNWIDAIVWTHDHADHCHGIDEVRQLFHARGGPVPGYARPSTLQVLKTRFAYAFRGNAGYPPTIDARVLPDRLTFGADMIHVVDQPHGAISSAGLVFVSGDKKFVYATDFKGMTPQMEAAYRDADLWVVDALRRAPHPTHPHLEQTLGWVDALSPKSVLLTHMDQSMDYAVLCGELPAHVRPAYDGLEVSL